MLCFVDFCCVFFLFVPVRVRYGVEFSLFDLQKKMGVMLVFTARNHQIVMELAKQVAEITDGKITEVRACVRACVYKSRARSRIRKKEEKRGVGGGWLFFLLLLLFFVLCPGLTYSSLL